MGLHTRKQFAELIGLAYDKDARAKIATWIRRGNIIIKDELIDDTDQQNKYWIEKQSALKKSNDIEKKPVLSLNKTEESTKSEESKAGKGKDEQIVGDGKNKYQLDLEKKKKEIEKLTVDTRLQLLKEEKIRGEVIPISIAKQIVSMLAQALITSHKDADEYLLIQISKEARLSGDQLARLRGKMVEALNEGSEKAILMAKKNLKALVDEFSIKKEVGEHE